MKSLLSRHSATGIESEALWTRGRQRAERTSGGRLSNATCRYVSLTDEGETSKKEPERQAAARTLRPHEAFCTAAGSGEVEQFPQFLEPNQNVHVIVLAFRDDAAGTGTRRMAEKGTVVLVVEDEPLIRLTTVDFLTDEGFTVLEAADADEAIRILEARNDVSVIFTDIQMPGAMDGLKLAHAVRGRWPPIRIIVTSAYRTHQRAQLPAGGRFFGKPYQTSKIVDAIRELTAL